MIFPTQAMTIYQGDELVAFVKSDTVRARRSRSPASTGAKQLDAADRSREGGRHARVGQRWASHQLAALEARERAARRHRQDVADLGVYEPLHLAARPRERRGLQAVRDRAQAAGDGAQGRAGPDGHRRRSRHARRAARVALARRDPARRSRDQDPGAARRALGRRHLPVRRDQARAVGRRHERVDGAVPDRQGHARRRLPGERHDHARRRPHRGAEPAVHRRHAGAGGAALGDARSPAAIASRPTRSPRARRTPIASRSSLPDGTILTLDAEVVGPVRGRVGDRCAREPGHAARRRPRPRAQPGRRRSW